MLVALNAPRNDVKEKAIEFEAGESCRRRVDFGKRMHHIKSNYIWQHQYLFKLRYAYKYWDENVLNIFVESEVQRNAVSNWVNGTVVCVFHLITCSSKSNANTNQKPIFQFNWFGLNINFEWVLFVSYS